jgi:hypothetical protein
MAYIIHSKDISLGNGILSIEIGREGQDFFPPNILRQENASNTKISENAIKKMSSESFHIE